MKKILGVLLLLICAPGLRAQTGFFFGVDAASSNVWTGTGINLVTGLVDGLLEWACEDWEVTPSLGGRYTLDIMNFRDDGGKVTFNPDDHWNFKQLYGFRKRDLFGHIIGNAKVGWMGSFSPIGFFFHAGYDYRNFAMLLPYQTEEQEYRIGTFNPGIGIRISPGNFFDLDNFMDLLLLEAGTNYNKRTYYKGPYNDDKDQLNNGLSYSVALGIGDSYTSILLGFEWARQDLFNRDYTPDGGLFYPYKNLSSKIRSVFFSINYGF